MEFCTMKVSGTHALQVIVFLRHFSEVVVGPSGFDSGLYPQVLGQLCDDFHIKIIFLYLRLSYGGSWLKTRPDIPQQAQKISTATFTQYNNHTFSESNLIYNKNFLNVYRASLWYRILKRYY